MSKKSAFSLAEVLIVMAIIGIIVTFGIRSFVRIDKSVKYTYSNVYHTLDRAIYNASFFTALKSPFAKKEYDENGAEVDIVDSGTKRLCMMLVEYINTSSQNCSADAVDDSGTGLTTPHFVSVNGVKFYISGLLPSSDSAPHKFFLIFADMNGDKKPNSMDYNPPNVEPDTFAFAVLDIGRVCPLGPPEVDQNFMQTRITYYSTESDGENQTTSMKFSSTSKPYYISKAEAWGYYLGIQGFDEDEYIEANPLTYNNYIRNNISKTSKIYSFLGNAKLNAPEGITFKGDTEQNGGYNCFVGSDVECDIIIDKFMF